MSKSYVDRLKSQREDLEESIHSVRRQEVDEERRAHRRHPYANTGELKITITHVGGTTVHRVVRPHDLCNTGVGFFTAGYLHPESECQVELITHDNEKLTVSGKVRRCFCVRGQVHYCGVSLDQELDAGMILGLAESAENHLPAGRSGIDEVKHLAQQVALIAEHDACWMDARGMMQDLKRLAAEEETEMLLEHYFHPDRIAIIGKDGIIAKVNPSFCVFEINQGYEETGFVGTNAFDYFASGSLKQSAQDTIREVLQGSMASFVCNYSVQTDQQIRECQLSVKPVEVNPERFVVRYHWIEDQGVGSKS